MIIITGGSGSRKMNEYDNLIKHKDYDDYDVIDKIYLYIEDSNESKYQYVIENVKTLAFISIKIHKLSLNNRNLSITIDEYNPNKIQKILIMFDDIIADIISNKRLNPMWTELLIRSTKLTILIDFITKSYFVKTLHTASLWKF